ncbi:MAG: YfhO family protein [Chloroflexi bacterium]|nr:YfhO family protein [Chloroflexota bacterium]
MDSPAWPPHPAPVVPITSREALKAGLLLFLLCCGFFGPALFSGRALLPADQIFDQDPLWQPLAPAGYNGASNDLLGDRILEFYPWRVFTWRTLAQGELPLWNPYTNGGQPFIGNAQSAVFDPLQWISFLFPLPFSVGVTLILRLWVAGIFTYLLARQLGLQKLGATLAMITFAFSGPLTNWVGHPHASVIAWLPALLFMTERMLVRKQRGYAIGASCAIGAQFLGGHPETSFPVLLTWGLFALYRSIHLVGWRWAMLGRVWLKLGVVALLGGLLAAIQLIPFLETFTHSIILADRLHEATNQPAPLLLRGLFTWQTWPSLLTTLLPNFFGTAQGNSYWYPYENYIELNGYVGVLPLVLALAIVIYYSRQRALRQHHWLLFWAGVAVVALGIALHAPVFNLISALPLFNISANGRFRFIYALAIALLAGFGLDALSQAESRLAIAVRKWLLVFALGSLVLIVAAYSGFRLFQQELIRNGRAFVEAGQAAPYLANHPLDYLYTQVEARQRNKLALYWPTNLTMYLPVIVALVYVVLQRWQAKIGMQVRLWQAALIALTILDLFLVGVPFTSSVKPAEIFPKPAAIDFLQQDQGNFRVGGTGLILNPNSGMFFELADVRGYEPLAPRRYIELLSQLSGFYHFGTHFLLTQADSPLLDLLNVKYMLTDQALTGKWQLVYPNSSKSPTRAGVKVFQNQTVLPRAFLVYQAEVVANPTASLARVVDPSFDFRTHVVLEEMPPQWIQTTAPVNSPRVAINRYTANRVEIQVQTAAAGILVLTDTYAPGWRALVDGQSTPLYVANHAFRAVTVPTGAHQVIFVYSPLTFWIGAALSGLTLMGLLLAGLWAFRTHRSSPQIEP